MEAELVHEINKTVLVSKEIRTKKKRIKN